MTAILVAFLLLSKKNFLPTKNQELIKDSKREKKEENKSIKKNNIENQNSKNDKILELTFEVNFQELYQSYKNNINYRLREENKLKQENKDIKEDKPKEELEKKNIKSKDLPPYETCIKLAKEYYEKGDYKQALKWAKNANIQDNTKASSWVITAKTLYKIGKKDEAVKLLEIYYSYTQDEKVKELIKNMN